MPTLPYGTDQLIDTAIARALHADACRDHAIVAWAVLWDLPAHPDRSAAQANAVASRPAPGGIGSSRQCHIPSDDESWRSSEAMIPLRNGRAEAQRGTGCRSIYPSDTA
jgi:hypothetical protein